MRRVGAVGKGTPMATQVRVGSGRVGDGRGFQPQGRNITKRVGTVMKMRKATRRRRTLEDRETDGILAAVTRDVNRMMAGVLADFANR